MKTIVFLLEEPSARDLLEGLLRRLVGDQVLVEFQVFEGKSDLERSLHGRIRGWKWPDSHFVVMRDQDSADCKVVKQRLVDRIPEALRDRTVVRVACRELESWALGDWHSVAQAFGLPKLSQNDAKAKYRDPDRLGNPVKELQAFLPTYQKRDGARRLGLVLDPDRNRSRSFQVFCAAIRAIVG